MTAKEQLHALWRQFPRSKDLAVSPALLAQYEAEMVRVERYVADPVPYSECVWGVAQSWPKLENYARPKITAQPLLLRYRDRRLVVVEPA